ncbi:hypothetical protein MYIN104542_10485 [Mycobacterium intermedium]
MTETGGAHWRESAQTDTPHGVSLYKHARSSGRASGHAA